MFKLESLANLPLTAIALGVLIFVHELGHFLACRICGIGVQKFSIGFGPEILSWQSPKTRYSLSLIPFGGYVKPQGETLEEIKSRGSSDTGDYVSAHPFSRLLVLVAGVGMNFLFAYLIFVLVLVMGRPVVSTVIGSLVEGYPASASELRVGDKITHLNGKAVSNWQDMTLQIIESSEKVLMFQVDRNGESLTIPVTAQLEEGKDIFGQQRKVPRIGIKPSKDFVIEKYDFNQAYLKAAEFELKLTSLTYEALGRLVTGQLSLKTISGPIGIVSMAGDAAKLGIPAFLQFMGLLSVSLAVINLLPIPALDGGHLLFWFFEVIFRKPLSLSVQERVTQIGFVFLMILMALVIYNDLANIGALEHAQSFLSDFFHHFYGNIEKILTNWINPNR